MLDVLLYLSPTLLYIDPGIGFLTILDGDRVRETDLHRQTLYDEQDARKSAAKAMAASAPLRVFFIRTASLH